MPPSESTATSVVPPPMSTTIEPVASVPGRAAPTPPPAPGGAAADAANHRAGRLGRRQAGADRRRHRLLDQENPPGAGAFRRFLDRAPLDGRPAGRHADDDLRAGGAAPGVHFADEMLDHFFRHFEIGDDAIAQWPDRLNVARRSA